MVSFLKGVNLNKKIVNSVNFIIGMLFVGSIIYTQYYQNNLRVSANNENEKIDLNWNLVSKTNGFPDINLEEYRGKVIFLNLWAEWCGPCISEMPSIQNLYTDYKDKISFVTVVVDYTEHTENYMSETGFCFPVYEAHLPQSYGYETFPTTWIIDKEGNIAIHHIGEFKWDTQEVKNLLESLL